MKRGTVFVVLLPNWFGSGDGKECIKEIDQWNSIKEGGEWEGGGSIGAVKFNTMIAKSGDKTEERVQ